MNKMKTPNPPRTPMDPSRTEYRNFLFSCLLRLPFINNFMHCLSAYAPGGKTNKEFTNAFSEQIQAFLYRGFNEDTIEELKKVKVKNRFVNYITPLGKRCFLHIVTDTLNRYMIDVTEEFIRGFYRNKTAYSKHKAEAGNEEPPLRKEKNSLVVNDSTLTSGRSGIVNAVTGNQVINITNNNNLSSAAAAKEAAAIEAAAIAELAANEVMLGFSDDSSDDEDDEDNNSRATSSSSDATSPRNTKR